MYERVRVWGTSKNYEIEVIDPHEHMGQSYKFIYFTLEGKILGSRHQLDEDIMTELCTAF